MLNDSENSLKKKLTDWKKQRKNSNKKQERSQEERSSSKIQTRKTEDVRIHYKKRYSSRAKKARIKFRNGLFTVVIPQNQPDISKELLENNQNWLVDKQKEWQKLRKNIPERKFEDGSKFKILDEEKILKIEKRRSNKVGDEIVLAEHLVNRTSVKDQLEKTLREHVRTKIEDIVDDYSSEINGSHENIYIRDQKTRWGSCSGKNNLNFNWRLVFAPREVLEYVVVHELTHLEHRNHSKQFWDRLEKLLPENNQGRSWLSENSHKLIYDPN